MPDRVPRLAPGRWRPGAEMLCTFAICEIANAVRPRYAEPRCRPPENHMDMLMKLYGPAMSVPNSRGSTGSVRKPLGPENDGIVAWIADHFSPGWASEARVALSNRPISLFVATPGEVLSGFCCYDATARGFVGPIGVAEEARGTGIGAALLLACLHDMRTMGYGYAIAGAVGAPEFFRRVAGATEIEGSTPGIYRGMLRP